MENREKNHEREKRTENLKNRAVTFLKAKGYYAAVFLCLGVLGAAAAIAMTPAETEDDPAATPAPSADAVSASEDERLAGRMTAAVSPAGTPSPAPAAAPDFTPAAATPKPKADKVPAPVKGEVVWKFAMDSLLYSKTLDQWTTHSGIDISCRKGTDVASVLPGTVEEVYEDARLGVTVVISHSEKRRTVYANLEKNPPVKAGDKVKAGDTIGKAGDTSITECGEEPHIHFEFIVNNAFVNPADYILTGE